MTPVVVTKVEAPDSDSWAGVTDPVVAATLVPTPFVAVTVKVYAVPFVSPGTVQLVAPVVVHVKFPGEEVTV